MKDGILAKAEGKSADTLPNSAGRKAHHSGRNETDSIGLAYQVQAAKQARAALLERVEEGKTFEEDWMRIYLR